MSESSKRRRSLAGNSPVRLSCATLCAKPLSSETLLNSPPISPERSTFAADALRKTGRLRLQVHGESMLPAIWPRAVVDVVHCSLDDVSPSEIVLALRNGRLFLHRFVRCESQGFLLQGDSMPGPDPLYPEDGLLGKLAGRAAFQESSFLARVLRRATGLLFCYCGPLRRGALHWHRLRDQRRQFRQSCASQAVHGEA